MPVSGLLLIAGLLSQVPTSSLPATRGTDAAASRVAADPQANAAQGESSPPQPAERLHQFGLGGSMGVGTGGGGGAFRLFFSGQLGLNTTVGWYRPMVNGPSQGSTFLVAPSAVYMLTKIKKDADVDVRPYVGGGLNYANGPRSFQTTTTVASRTSGLGMQAFGGVELTFQDAKSLAISAEVAHYRLVAPAFSSNVVQGTNFYLLFHYYLR